MSVKSILGCMTAGVIMCATLKHWEDSTATKAAVYGKNSRLLSINLGTVKNKTHLKILHRLHDKALYLLCEWGYQCDNDQFADAYAKNKMLVTARMQFIELNIA